MRELFKICLKIKGFFNFLGALETVRSEFDQKRCKGQCSYVSEINSKNSLLEP